MDSQDATLHDLEAQMAAAVHEFHRRIGAAGGRARVEQMTPAERSEHARRASWIRWGFKPTWEDTAVD